MASNKETQPYADPPEVLSIREAAEHFGVSSHTVRRWIREGRLQAEQRPGRHGVQYFIPTDQPDPRVESASVHNLAIVDPVEDDSLVGRTRESRIIEQALRAMLDGNLSVLFVSGEAGIGKTALVQYLRRVAASNNVLVLTGNCYELENTPPYGPWIEILREFAEHSAVPAVPEIDPSSLDFAGSSSELHGRFEGFFADASERQPLAIVLEDLHWADKPSLELLRHLTRRLSRCNVLLFVTYRDDELLVDQPLHHLLPTLVREASPLRLRLSPLGTEEIDELVRSRYELPDADHRGLVAYLLQYSDGVPFYVEELATHLENEGVLDHVDGRWRLTRSPEVDVPPLVRQVAINRFTALSAEARRHLQAAAVVGVEAPVTLLQEVTGAPVEVLATSIEVALRARLIEEDPGLQCIRFRHALIREAIYRSLIVLRRRDMHRLVGEKLAAQANADPDIVAHHFSQAQDPRAAEWLLAGARRAAQTFAYQEAISRFEQALDILSDDRDADLTRAWVLCELAIAYRYMDPHHALQLVGEGLDIAIEKDAEALESVLRRTRSHIRGFIGENGLPELRAAVAMFEALPRQERDRIEQSSLGNAVSGGAYAQRVAYYAQYSEAKAIAEQFLESAPYPRIKRDHYEFGLAHLALGMAHANLGNPESARAEFASARASFAEASNNYLYGMALTHEFNHVVQVYYPDRVDERRWLIEAVDKAFSLSVMAYLGGEDAIARLYNALIIEGRWEEARRSALALVENAYMRVECASVLALIDSIQGRYDYAWEWIRRAIPLGPDTEPGTVYHHDIVQIQQVATHLALQAGDLDLAHRWVVAHDHWTQFSDTILDIHAPHLLWAAYHHAAGDTARAIDRAGKAVQAAQTSRQPYALLHATRSLAEYLIHSGDLDQACSHIRLAVELATSFAAPYEIALSEQTHAKLRLAEGRADDAEALLNSARTRLVSLGAWPAVEDLEKLESRLDTQPTTRNDVPAGLSPRELEVLQLVATGMTDAEIADQLFISPRTVGGHLQSIYQKTGVSSRTAATAYAFTHGLAKSDP